MSTPLALQDILLSIANSLSQAQEQLNNMPLYDSSGNSSTIYQLPYLDFNIVLEANFDSEESLKDEKIKLDSKITSDAKYSRAAAAFALSRAQMKKLLFTLPPSTTDGDSKPSTESSKSLTTISGRFVAVLPNEGLPQTVLNVSYEQDEKTKTKFIIKVNLVNTAGENLANQLVEFNFDEEASKVLSTDAEAIKAPKFSSQEEYTNSEGYAETDVTINNNKNCTIVIRVNSGIATKSISI